MLTRAAPVASAAAQRLVVADAAGQLDLARRAGRPRRPAGRRWSPGRTPRRGRPGAPTRRRRAARPAPPRAGRRTPSRSRRRPAPGARPGRRRRRRRAAGSASRSLQSAVEGQRRPSTDDHQGRHGRERSGGEHDPQRQVVEHEQPDRGRRRAAARSRCRRAGPGCADVQPGRCGRGRAAAGGAASARRCWRRADLAGPRPRPSPPPHARAVRRAAGPAPWTSTGRPPSCAAAPRPRRRTSPGGTAWRDSGPRSTAATNGSSWLAVVTAAPASAQGVEVGAAYEWTK